MQYKNGMYGGCFDPLHLGHISIILDAASQCETLHVILSWSERRDRIPMKVRYRWLKEITKHLPNVTIHAVEDTAMDKSGYNWFLGAENIQQAVGVPIDCVFAGSDYTELDFFEKLYPNSTFQYYNRNVCPVSSTMIYSNPLKYWDYIPKVAKYYFCKKVLLVGGESCGKSVLAENLALTFNSGLVREVGRETCERAGGEDYMTAEDLHENLIRQRAEIYKAEHSGYPIIFVDTDSLTTGFYGELLRDDTTDFFKWQACEDLAYNINDTIQWDLILFLEPVVPWVQDGTRNEEIAADRKKYSQDLKNWYTALNLPLNRIDGEDYATRYRQAVNAVKTTFQI